MKWCHEFESFGQRKSARLHFWEICEVANTSVLTCTFHLTLTTISPNRIRFKNWFKLFPQFAEQLCTVHSVIPVSFAKTAIRDHLFATWWWRMAPKLHAFFLPPRLPHYRRPFFYFSSLLGNKPDRRKISGAEHLLLYSVSTVSLITWTAVSLLLKHESYADCHC